MRLLRLAVELQRWDLAAHTIVLAAATTLKNGDKPDIKSKSKEKKPASGGFPQLCPLSSLRGASSHYHCEERKRRSNL